jgi:hypothetical protein
MPEPIRIHATDTEDEAKARHEEVVKRLDALGVGQVRDLLRTGGLPTGWNPIILDWLKGK